MKHQIFSRWDRARIVYECELPDNTPSDRVVRGAYLRGAYLRYSYLRYADLSETLGFTAVNVEVLK